MFLREYQLPFGTLLDWAVQNGHLEVVKLLLASYVEVDVLARNNFGRGALTEAFEKGVTEVVGVLLEHDSATEEKLSNTPSSQKAAEETDAVADPNAAESVQTKVVNLAFQKIDATTGPTINIREVVSSLLH